MTALADPAAPPRTHSTTDSRGAPFLVSAAADSAAAGALKADLFVRLPREAGPVLRACLPLPRADRAVVLGVLLEGYLLRWNPAQAGAWARGLGPAGAEAGLPTRYVLSLRKTTADYLVALARTAGQGHSAESVAGLLLWGVWRPAVEIGLATARRRADALPLVPVVSAGVRA